MTNINATGGSSISPRDPEYIVRGQGIDWYLWTWDKVNNAGLIGFPPYFGTKTATQSTTKVRGLGLFLDTIVGANLVWNAGLNFTSIIPANGGAHHVFSFPWYWAMRFNRSTPIGVNSGECFQGIGWGDPFNLNTPWTVNFPGDTSLGNVFVAYDYVSQTFKYSVYLLDGNTPVYTDCSFQPAFAVDANFVEVAMRWTPNPNPSLQVILNRRVSDIITPAQNPRIGDLANGVVNTGNGPYVFWTNGSGAGRRAFEAGYYTGYCWYNLPL